VLVAGWALLLGIIGTVTGVLALGWQIISQLVAWRTDRPRLVLTSESMTDMEYPDQWTYWITVTNHGGSDAKVHACGLRPPSRRRRWRIRRPQFPEGEDWDIGAPFSAVIESDMLGRMKPDDQVELYWDGEAVEAICEASGIRPDELRPWVEQTTGKRTLGPPLPKGRRQLRAQAPPA
jgi:hypothetical protein